MCAAAFRTNAWCVVIHDHLTAVIAVIGRDTVSPPELSGDTPVTDIVGPVIVHGFRTFGDELNRPVLDGLFCRLNQLVHLDEPLLFNHRFDGHVTTFVRADIMRVVFDAHEESHLVQFFDNLFACGIALHTRKLAAVFVDGRIVIHNIDFRQVMTFADLKVVGVVRRRNLDNAGTKLHVDVRICHNRNLSLDKG